MKKNMVETVRRRLPKQGDSKEQGINLFQECSLLVHDSVLKKVVSKKVVAILERSSFRFQVRQTYILFLDLFSFLEVLKSFSEEVYQTEEYAVCFIGNTIVEISFSFRKRNEIFVEMFLSSDTLENLQKQLEKIKSLFSECVEKRPYCTIDWMYISSGQVSLRTTKERLDDIVYKEAYPYIDLDNLVSGYLKSLEPILILFGPPGTGKTRLIRYILKKFTEQKQGEKENNSILYASQPEVIEKSSIFVDFVFDAYNFLVLEDIDRHLKPRTEDNNVMYGLLSSSNGIVVSLLESKKIVLSTNLPNVTRVDDALKRPGRCFSIVETRRLTFQEAINFLEVSSNKDLIGLLPKTDKGFALSDLYRLIDTKTFPDYFERVSGFIT